jgi:hypothetical protein
LLLDKAKRYSEKPGAVGGMEYFSSEVSKNKLPLETLVEISAPAKVQGQEDHNGLKEAFVQK